MAKTRPVDRNFEDILKLDDPYFRLVKKEFEHRLNKLYTHPLLGELLDNGEIDFAILDFIEQLFEISKDGKTYLDPNARAGYLAMVCDRETRFGRIFQAAIDLNIVYKSKYLDMMYLEHNLYSQYVL